MTSPRRHGKWTHPTHAPIRLPSSFLEIVFSPPLGRLKPTRFIHHDIVRQRVVRVVNGRDEATLVRHRRGLILTKGERGHHLHYLILYRPIASLSRGGVAGAETGDEGRAFRGQRHENSTKLFEYVGQRCSFWLLQTFSNDLVLYPFSIPLPSHRCNQSYQTLTNYDSSISLFTHLCSIHLMHSYGLNSI